MLFDTHMHADYSCDAEMTIKDAMEAAKAAGLGMILTEHWDRDYPTNPESFLFDINDYFKKTHPIGAIPCSLALNGAPAPYHRGGPDGCKKPSL